MKPRHNRKPIRNFFVIYPFQIRILLVIGMTVFMTLSLTLVSLFISFQYIVKSGDLYFLASDSGKRLPILNITWIISTGIALTIFISLIVSIVAGLISSRKAAVPIYKIERWIEAIENGNLKANIHFREKNTEISDLAHRCNSFSHKIWDIHQRLTQLAKDLDYGNLSETDKEKIRGIKENVERLKKREHI